MCELLVAGYVGLGRSIAVISCQKVPLDRVAGYEKGDIWNQNVLEKDW